MSKIEKILILKSGHQLTVDDIKRHTFATDVCTSPSEIYTIEEQVVIMSSVHKIIEFLDVNRGAKAYFVWGDEATSSHFRLQLDPMFVGAYQLSVEQFKICHDAASVFESIQQTRGYITDAFNAHHWPMDPTLNPNWRNMLKKYDSSLEDIYEEYGIEEMSQAKAVIEEQLNSIW